MVSFYYKRYPEDIYEELLFKGRVCLLAAEESPLRARAAADGLAIARRDEPPEDPRAAAMRAAAAAAGLFLPRLDEPPEDTWEAERRAAAADGLFLPRRPRGLWVQLAEAPAELLRAAQERFAHGLFEQIRAADATGSYWSRRDYWLRKEVIELLRAEARPQGMAVRDWSAAEEARCNIAPPGRDALTGLHDWAALDFACERLRKTQPLSVVLVDIAALTAANRSLGHEAADRLVARVGEALAPFETGERFLARIGPERDEFALLLPGVEHGGPLRAQIAATLARLDLPEPLRAAYCGVHTLARSRQDGEEPQQLLFQAQLALETKNRRRRSGEHAPAAAR